MLPVLRVQWPVPCNDGVMRSICDDLVGEHDDLDRIVASIGSAEWLTATPSPGWDVRDQISHLWFFDQRAVMALTDPEAFAADVAWLVASGGTDASVAPGARSNRVSCSNGGASIGRDSSPMRRRSIRRVVCCGTARRWRRDRS